MQDRRTKTKRRPAFWHLLFCLLALGPPFAGAAVPPAAANTVSRPNILFIMIDDLGWMDLGCQGNADYHTPNIDRLASQGIRFTDAYAAAPVCSPTRAAAITGLAPARLRITNHLPDQRQFYEGKSWAPGACYDHLATERVTIAERLKTLGYGTGFFGKWHLSGTRWSEENRIFLPQNQGFDVNIGGCNQGGPGGKGSFFDPYAIPNIPSRKPGEFLADRLADEAVAFIQQQQQAGKSFFVCLWDYTVHWPIEAPDELIRKYAPDGKPSMHQSYQAMVEGMDRAVGRVLTALDDMKLAQDTMVVFTSDNGPFTGGDDGFTSAKPLRGSKGYLYEGGIRVPLIIRWPGKIKSGTVSTEPVITMDLVPTFLEAAGTAPQNDIFDGESLVPLLTENKLPQRPSLYFHYPHYAFHKGNRMGSIIRSGDYKLILHHDSPQGIELYNLRTDIGEAHDLATEQPERAARMQKQLQQWLTDTDAAMPRPKENQSK